MSFILNGNRYHFIIASDIIRDGLGIELHRSDTNECIAEIFRNDHLRQIQFSCWEQDVPFEAIDRLIQEFEVSVERTFQT